ncbi:hypothetical protein HIM_01834 [Hirsutella minnesotensis 3608]|nr:hypothetical protein HIM_01834 [Hirsutella minnesotensis 3608]
MSPVPTHRGAQDGVVSIVCIRCREEKPAEDFLTRRKSVGHTRSCLSCRNQRASHVEKRDPDLEGRRNPSSLASETRIKENRPSRQIIACAEQIWNPACVIRDVTGTSYGEVFRRVD